MIKVYKFIFLFVCFVAFPLAADDWHDVVPGKILAFPRAHGSHRNFPLEWWYVTGHMYDDQGDHYGFQFTVFRVGIHKESPGASAWHTSSLFIGHQAVSDTRRKEFSFCESVHREQEDQVFAKRDYLHTRTPNQEITYDGKGPMTLRLSCKGKELQLTLTPRKPIILQGDKGYSQKGEGVGNASYYTSFTRLEGSARLNGLPLEASAWYDHEVLSASVSGDDTRWDWFSIQLDDDTEIMLYRLRNEAGEASKFSSGVIVDSSGSTRTLGYADFSLEATRYWTTDDGLARYPVAWNLAIPSGDIVLQLEATMDHQELRTEKSTGKRYWEGAAQVRGSSAESSVTGMAFVELVGYARRDD